MSEKENTLRNYHEARWKYVLDIIARLSLKCVGGVAFTIAIGSILLSLLVGALTLRWWVANWLFYGAATTCVLTVAMSSGLLFLGNRAIRSADNIESQTPLRRRTLERLRESATLGRASAAPGSPPDRILLRPVVGDAQSPAEGLLRAVVGTDADSG